MSDITGIQNNHIQNFLALLCGEIHDTQIDRLMVPVQWEEVFKLAQIHNVYALVFDKAAQTAGFLSDSGYERYLVRSTRQVAGQIQRTHAFLQLYQAFTENGLHPIVMKGIICRQLYGALSEHRPSGDEDILVKKQDFRKVKKILESQGYRAEHENITESQLEKLQEISFYHPDTGLNIEVHTNPIGHENSLRHRMNDFFQSVFEKPRKVVIEHTELFTMNHTDHFLFLVLHAFKHMMVSGFGIRQVLDILLYGEKYSEEIDWNYVNAALEKVGARAFFADLIHIGNQYLGFRFPVAASPNCPEVLFEDIIHNGVFGNETQAQCSAINMTGAAMENQGKGGKLRIFIKTIFPSRKFLLAGYPELADRPWRLPVCWIKRWLQFLKHNRKYKGNLAKESIEISNRRIELLKKYEVL